MVRDAKLHMQQRGFDDGSYTMLRDVRLVYGNGYFAVEHYSSWMVSIGDSATAAAADVY